jgi:hypothetical protein
MDPDPTVAQFDCEDDAAEWLADEIEHRIQYMVAHSAYEISESDIASMYEIEYSLARIEESE